VESGAATGCDLRYRAFISYSHADARWATWLHRRLEGYRLPSRLRGGTGEHGPLPDRLSPIFRDREDLSSAGHLGPQIQAALAESEALVVVCSPGAARSPWVDSEIRAFKRLGRGDRIYAFIVDGEPNAGDARECFPEALRFDLAADGESPAGGANPGAPDGRVGKDGRSRALLRLLAGLFGLPLDTLRQREAQRRHRRMAAITALAVLVMLVTSVLAVQAVMARKAAERRQKQAEALVDFMLGDLNDRLAEVSRLDIMSSVHDKAMAYFQSLPATDVTDEALVQRAKALARIGIVRTELGRLPQALESYEAAGLISARLAAAAPTDIPRQLAHADVLSFIGMTRWYQGDLDGAQQGFDQADKVLTAARRLAPTDTDVLFALSGVDNNVGHVLEARGQMEEAERHYRRMLEATRTLDAKAPDNIAWQNQLGLAHNNLAKMAVLRGDLAAALREYQADVAIQARMAARDARNNAQRERLLISRATLGRTLALAGQLDEGAALTATALADAEALHAMEPKSTLYQEDIGLYATQLARLRRLQGDAEAAARLTARSLQVLQSMLKQSPDQPGWRRELAEAQVEQAEQAIASGRRDDAAAPLRQALAILEPQLLQNPNDRAVVLATVSARLGLASLAADGADARGLSTRALATLDAQAYGKRDPRLLVLRVEALRRLSRAQEAAAAAAELAATGYRDAGSPRTTRVTGKAKIP